MYLEFGTMDALLLCLAVLVILYIINSLYFTIPLPQGVALIREPPGKRSFSFRTRLEYINDCEAIFREAYHKVRLFKQRYGICVVINISC